MRRMTLRRKILVYSSSLLILLILATLGYVNYRAGQFVTENIERDLQAGRERVTTVEAQRLEALRLTASLVASIPQLRALVLETDSATVRDFLNSYKQRNGRPETFLVLDAGGEVFARSDRSDPSPVPDLTNALANSGGQSVAGAFLLDDGFYHGAAIPSEAAGIVFGYIAAIVKIDSTFALELAGIGDDVVIVGDSVLGSSRPDSQLTLRTRQDWEDALSNPTVTLAGETFIATPLRSVVEGEAQPMYVLMKSYTQAMMPYRQILAGLSALGVLVILAGIAGSAVLARNVTAPVVQLTKGTQQVAAGNFEYRIDVRSGDELGDLAQSFNVMIQGLRERADMQKFVSQSTVDMIQTRAEKKISAGERKTLTIFFSDMRGFTGISEHMRPEETVTILNMCLSLQAEKVKKYHGDIDKYVGDCVVALFSGEDMELNAIRCAVEIHRALDELNASRPDEAALLVGVGIVTGEVILGSIGSEDRLDYTVIGSNVNLSSRLCSLAGPHETLLAQSTYDRVEGLVAADRLEPLTVKGFTEPVPVYRMSLSRSA